MRPKCSDCPHFGESLKGVAELEVRGKKQDYHPCHNNTELMCVGAIERLGLIQAGAPLNGDVIKFTHEVTLQ
jgi:hypothetical protein